MEMIFYIFRKDINTTILLKMENTEFRKRLANLETAKSIRGKIYHSISIDGDKIRFTRKGNSKSESILVEELYFLFISEKEINTKTAKLYISGRVQSPAVAILKKIREKSPITEVHSLLKKKKLKFFFDPQDKLKDEAKFFTAFSEVVGEKFLLSRSIGKPINANHVFLSNDFEKYLFYKEINDAYVKILNALKSNFTFSSDSLSHYVDGLLLNHPILGTRIVEFDEEQHFTPARKETLEIISKEIDNIHSNHFIKICNDLNYLNHEVLKKHRIKNKLKKVPVEFKDFVKWLEKSDEKESDYICSKNGFTFLGGRFAQRAYYDCLRDTAHLSSKNKDFTAPLRFAKKNFEEQAKIEFKSIPQEKLVSLIMQQLNNLYGIKSKK